MRNLLLLEQGVYVVSDVDYIPDPDVIFITQQPLCLGRRMHSVECFISQW